MTNIEKMVKEIKVELLNKEMTLLDMDNELMNALETNNSIFDGDTESFIEDRNFVYQVQGLEDEIMVDFKVIEKNEDNLETIVKVTNVETI